MVASVQDGQTCTLGGRRLLDGPPTPGKTEGVTLGEGMSLHYTLHSCHPPKPGNAIQDLILC